MEKSIIFTQAALFKCTQCATTLDLYNDEEFITEVADESMCYTCHKREQVQLQLTVAYQYQPENKYLIPYPFSSVVASPGFEVCKNCLGKENFRWTEAIFSCPSCQNKSLSFQHLVEGEAIGLFKKMAVYYSLREKENKTAVVASGISLGRLKVYFIPWKIFWQIDRGV